MSPFTTNTVKMEPSFCQVISKRSCRSQALTMHAAFDLREALLEFCRSTWRPFDPPSPLTAGCSVEGSPLQEPLWADGAHRKQLNDCQRSWAKDSASKMLRKEAAQVQDVAWIQEGFEVVSCIYYEVFLMLLLSKSLVLANVPFYWCVLLT